ncbi:MULTISPECIES: cold shock domain-containing protein [Vibrio]|uniref:CSD domain-containing protein n=2 Tax=Vibrio cyclitrophicus TaxID=47951 RepID=A0A7Z1MHA8_9VIBR|nr:cold shock domain-containing protein [Vibrio cyclitrophicus]PMP16738.1 hypothetical protein BCS91_26105 [Vibrio cyclitrophicus]PMP26111.1 hypothetical protein BCS90_23695 [Vibrio cyclitrophicus]
MRGKIIRWISNRGFGFIKSDEYERDIFIHISDITKRRRQPKVGDTVEFRLDTSEGIVSAKAASIISPSNKVSTTFINIVAMTVLCFLVASLTAYNWRKNDLPILSKPDLSSQNRNPPPLKFYCEGKIHCREMTSCEEAMFYLRNCPNVKIDGDNDNIPCERQHC